MSDADFLAAICDAPDEDAPRLVYADHLLESHEPARRQHGEFIIAQCDLARLSPNTEAWRRAKQREEELSPSVTRRPAKEATWSIQQWTRGFPSIVRCTPNKLRKAKKHLGEIPMQQIALFAADAGQPVIPTLGDLAWVAAKFPRLRGIRFGNREGSLTLDPKLLAGIAEDDKAIAWNDGGPPHVSISTATTALALDGVITPYLNEPFPHLEDLALRGADADSMRMMSNRTLKSLRWQADGDARFVHLSRLDAFAQLEGLDANVRLDAELAKGIMSSSITNLSLRHDATKDGIERFVPPPNLRRLALLFSGGRWYEFTPEKVRFLLPPGDYGKLESLHLGRFIVDYDFSALDFPSLAEFELTECRFEPTFASKLTNLFRPVFRRCHLDGSAQRVVREQWPDGVID